MHLQPASPPTVTLPPASLVAAFTTRNASNSMLGEHKEVKMMKEITAAKARIVKQPTKMHKVNVVATRLNASTGFHPSLIK